MRRIWAVLLICALALSLPACSGRQAALEEDDWVLRREKMTQEEADQAPEENQLFTLSTACGEIQGIQKEGYREFRGIRYATAERWEEAVAVTGWDGVYDATVWGDRSCQYYGFYNIADISVEDLEGVWDITGWNVLADGSFSAVTDQTFEFKGGLLSYYISGKLASASEYVFKDAYNIGVGGAEWSLIWTLYWNEDGTRLLIEDPAYAIAYVCVKTDQ